MCKYSRNVEEKKRIYARNLKKFVKVKQFCHDCDTHLLDADWYIEIDYLLKEFEDRSGASYMFVPTMVCVNERKESSV